MRDRAGVADQIRDIAVGVEQVVGSLICIRARDQVCTAQVCDRLASDMLADHVPAVEQEICLARSRRFTCADALRVVGIRRGQTMLCCTKGIS